MVEKRLTHFDELGRARMVDVGRKRPTVREAVARGSVRMHPDTLRLVREGHVAKGDVLGAARLAGIMAAKKTAGLIPLCHPLAITSAGVDFRLDERGSQVEIEARVGTTDRTGVEMEALVAVAVAALTIYDMCKAVDRGMTVDGIRLVSKRGGRSGEYHRPEEQEWPEVHAAGPVTERRPGGRGGDNDDQSGYHHGQ